MSAKYFRTPHLPFSPGGTSDDRRLLNVLNFVHVSVVITEKLDGSNLCMTRNSVFARSHAAAPAHPSFDMAKQVHAKIAHRLSEGISVFGEWVFAVHSIEYSMLPGYFCVFGVREDTNDLWWDWDMVRTLAEDLNLPTVPELFRGVFHSAAELETKVTGLCKLPSACGGEREGIVLRIAEQFTQPEISIAKFVRKDHVQTSEHWKNQAIRRNVLRK